MDRLLLRGSPSPLAPPWQHGGQGDDRELPKQPACPGPHSKGTQDLYAWGMWAQESPPHSQFVSRRLFEGGGWKVSDALTTDWPEDRPNSITGLFEEADAAGWAWGGLTRRRGGSRGFSSGSWGRFPRGHHPCSWRGDVSLRSARCSLAGIPARVTRGSQPCTQV